MYRQVGIFEMASSGMRSVTDPSSLALAESTSENTVRQPPPNNMNHQSNYPGQEPARLATLHS